MERPDARELEEFRKWKSDNDRMKLIRSIEGWYRFGGIQFNAVTAFALLSDLKTETLENILKEVSKKHGS